MPYRIKKASPTPPLVVQLKLHPLQEDKHTQNMRIQYRWISSLGLNLLPKLSQPRLHLLVERRCYWILRFALVDESAAKRAVGLNETLKRLTSIVVDQAFEAGSTFRNGGSYDKDKRLVIAEEFFFDDDVRMGNFFRRQFTQLLTVAAQIQKFTVKRTGDSFFALFATTLRADVGPQSGTESLCSASAANRTFLGHLF